MLYMSVKQKALDKHSGHYVPRNGLLRFADSLIPHYAIIFGPDSSLEPPCGQNMPTPYSAIKKENSYGRRKTIAFER
jgi:hypothetical protein